jgi:hypothetical protein
MNTSAADTSRDLKSPNSKIKIFGKALISVLGEFVEPIIVWCIGIVVASWLVHLLVSFAVLMDLLTDEAPKAYSDLLFFTSCNINLHVSFLGLIAYFLIKFSFKVKDRMRSFE